MSDLEWTDADSAYANWEALSVEHPARVLRAFNDAAWIDPLPVELMEALVTPEVRGDWGDFSTAAEFFRQGVGIGLNVRRIGDVHDVVYLKLTDDMDVTVRRTEEIPVLAYVTLVWRPELGGWKIHSIGEPEDANRLPRTSPEDAPRY